MMEYDLLRRLEFKRGGGLLRVDHRPRHGGEPRRRAEERDVLRHSARVYRRHGDRARVVRASGEAAVVGDEEQADGSGRHGRLLRGDDRAVVAGGRGRKLVLLRVVEVGPLRRHHVDVYVLNVAGRRRGPAALVGAVYAVARPEEVGEILLGELLRAEFAGGHPLRQGLHKRGLARQIGLFQRDGLHAVGLRVGRAGAQQREC